MDIISGKTKLVMEVCRGCLARNMSESLQMFVTLGAK
jgi:hypothetical protein